MEAEVSEAVNALLCDDSGSDWEKDFCNESDSSFGAQLENHAPLEKENDRQRVESDDGIPPPSAKHMKALKTFFGHSQFRPMQWKIIYSIIEKKNDNLVIMATGHGKSLCYQYPAVYCSGITIVISPLISLMQDQVLSLKVANISACFLGSAQSDKEVSKGAVNGEYRVVYVTPEFATGDTGKQFFNELMQNRIKLTLVAVDESHCVSQWGHDFRSSYRNLGRLRNSLLEVPFLAVTATATPEVKLDIIKSLHLRNPTITCTGFDRPNLYLKVCPKGSNVFDDLKSFMVKADGHWTFNGSTIIYCPTKKTTTSVTECLKGLGVECEEYHAGLRLDVRKSVHEQFVKDKVKVIVATVAFGMGIDKPDVRLIIHYGAPRDIESYYQEIGRAGRDGLPASCLVFYSRSDFLLSRHFLKTVKEAKFKKHKETMGILLENYLETRECRRRFILNHFQDVSEEVNEVLTNKCCDNCSEKLSYKNAGIDMYKIAGLDDFGRYDFTNDAKLLLDSVDLFDGHFGLTVPIRFLRGSKSNRLREDMMRNDLFGKGKDKAEDYWKNLGRLLVRNGYLEENESKSFRGGFGKKGFQMVTIGLSEKGKQSRKHLMSARESDKYKIKLIPPSNMLESIKKLSRTNRKLPIQVEHVPLPSVHSALSSGNLISSSTSRSPSMNEKDQVLQHKLYGELVSMRNHLASENNCMPYMVASDKSLLEMTRLRPSTVESLSKVEGFNEAKLKKFGGALVEKLVRFCQQNDLGLDAMTKDNRQSNVSESKVAENEKLACLNDTIKATYVAFQRNKMAVEKVARDRNLKESTLIGHLGECMKHGLQVDLHRLQFTKSIYKIIENVVFSPPLNGDYTKLTPIKNLCPPDMTWDHIKLAIGIFNLRRYSSDNQQFDKKLNELFSSQQQDHPKKECSKISLRQFSFDAGPSKSNEVTEKEFQEEPSRHHGHTPQARSQFSSERISECSPSVKNKLSHFAFEAGQNHSKLQYDDDDTDVENSMVMNSNCLNVSSSSNSSDAKFTYKKPSLMTENNSKKLCTDGGGCSGGTRISSHGIHETVSKTPVELCNSKTSFGSLSPEELDECNTHHDSFRSSSAEEERPGSPLLTVKEATENVDFDNASSVIKRKTKEWTRKEIRKKRARLANL